MSEDLTNKDFLTRLTSLMELSKSTQGSCTVFITMKQYNPSNFSQGPNINSTLIRATCGEIKIRSIIESKDSDLFMDQYCQIIKYQMDSLKKKEKKKKLYKSKEDKNT